MSLSPIPIVHTNPELEIMCEQLEDPENGKVTQPSRIAGAVAEYECNQGFTLVGAETRTCEASGRWSGKAPVCISERACFCLWCFQSSGSAGLWGHS